MASLLDRLNDSPFQKLDGTRRQLFEEIDLPALRPLPESRYVFSDHKKARVNVDYHIDVDLEDQARTALCQDMTFEERLGLLVDREMTDRTNRQVAIRLKVSKLHQEAGIEDVDFRHARNLDRSLIASLSSCSWIPRHDNCLITGPTGVGKTFLACALASKACREGYRVTYERTSRLLESLAIARAEGRYARRLAAVAKYDLLVLDDWGLAPLNTEQCRDLLEIFEDRYDRRSTLVTSQIPVQDWHRLLTDPTIADAALDRILHNSHRIELRGESMRRSRSKTIQTELDSNNATQN